MVGRMVLDRNPTNFFAETEQVAYCAGNVVPGVDFSNDPLLHGRLFSYLDTQLSRLGGPNFHQIPINQPKCPFANLQRDGHMQMGVPAGQVNYEPSSLGADIKRESASTGYRSFPAEEAGPITRTRPESFADHYSQARLFFTSQTEPEQDHIVSALVFELSKCTVARVRSAVLARLINIDESMAERVAAALGLREPIQPTERAGPIHEMTPSPALSILAKAKPTLMGRKIGCLVSDGADDDLLAALQDAAVKAGAKLQLIAPMIGGIETAGGALIPADHAVQGGPSVLFDAVILAPSLQGGATMALQAEAVNFVRDAYGHLKVIGYLPTAAPLLVKAGVDGKPDNDPGLVALNLDSLDLDAFLERAAAGRIWGREPWVHPVP